MLRTLIRTALLGFIAVIGVSGIVQGKEATPGTDVTPQPLQSVPTTSVSPDSDIQQQFAQALALEKAGKLDEAMRVYAKLIQEQPALPEAYNNLAGLYVQRGELTKAKSLLEAGLHTNASFATLFENLSAINVTMARDSYSKALQLNLKPVQLHLKPLALAANVKPVEVARLDDKVSEKPQVTQPVIAKPAPAETVTDEKSVPGSDAVAVKRVEPAQSEELDKITTTLHAWAAAWSAQAVDMYLSFYHPAYTPPGMSRQAWEASRRQRLTAPRWIKVSLTEIKVQKQSADETVVSFLQHYQSNSYRDNGYKKITLKRVPAGLQIVAEESL